MQNKRATRHIDTTNDPTDLTGLIVIEEAALRVARSVTTLRRWIADGRLRTKRRLGRVLVVAADLVRADGQD